MNRLIGSLGIVALLTGCSGEPPAAADVTVGAVTTIEQRLEETLPPPAAGATAQYQDEQTFDCPGGSGTATIKVTWSYREEPYSRKLHVHWTYDACKTRRYGTLNGTLQYARSNEHLVPLETWQTKSQYHADVDYTDAIETACDAYMTETKQSTEQLGDMHLMGHCRHPALFWLGQWRLNG